MIEVRTLGGLLVLQEGDPVQLPSRKAAALLAYLALNQGRVLARTELAALLWADTTSDHARHSLAQALYSLRRCLPTLVIDAGRSEERRVGKERGYRWGG